jgi:hypothetical protein
MSSRASIRSILKFWSEITQERNKRVARMRHQVATHTCKISHLLLVRD